MPRRTALTWIGVLVCTWGTSLAVLSAQDTTTPPTSLERALPPEASGENIYQAACATCHAIDGTGAPQSVVGFALPLPNGHGFPDFTDCPTSTVEPLADWAAVVARGGPVRALDRHMPAFGDALSPDQIDQVLRYIWTFCPDAAWPRGELNLPRPFVTEKAFPENETVWTTGFATGSDRAVSNELVYERRIGSRAQWEVKIPIDFQRNDAATWVRGLGDVEFAVKRAFHANVARGRIFSAGAAVIVPTGKEELGLGKGVVIYEPFAMFGQLVGAGFVQLHAGYEFPSDDDKAAREGFFRTAVGYTVAGDQGFGRAWTPMAEVVVAAPDAGVAEWDVIPQVQVSLSKLQHVLLNVGVRVPLTQREDRKPQVLTYLLWDWFDGGFFQFWK